VDQITTDPLVLRVCRATLYGVPLLGSARGRAGAFWLAAALPPPCMGPRSAVYKKKRSTAPCRLATTATRNPREVVGHIDLFRIPPLRSPLCLLLTTAAATSNGLGHSLGAVKSESRERQSTGNSKVPAAKGEAERGHIRRAKESGSLPQSCLQASCERRWAALTKHRAARNHDQEIRDRRSASQAKQQKPTH
jgi:hypothetical protein